MKEAKKAAPSDLAGPEGAAATQKLDSGREFKKVTVPGPGARSAESERIGNTGADIAQKEQDKSVQLQKAEQDGEGLSQLLHFDVKTSSLSLSLLQLFITTTNNYLTEHKGRLSLAAICEVTNSLKPILELYSTIQDYIEHPRQIQATILVLCLRRDICYLNVIHKLFPFKNPGHIYQILNSMVAKNLIERREESEEDLKQKRLYETAALTRCNMSREWVEKIVYYGITASALPTIKAISHELEKAIPEDVLKEISEPGLKTTLYHTEQEHRVAEGREIKIITDNFSKLWSTHEATLTQHYGKGITQELSRRLNEKYPEARQQLTRVQYQAERLLILESMIKEATRRKSSRDHRSDHGEGGASDE